MIYEPTGAERRITIRLLAYWEKMRGSRLMPAEEDIDPDDIQDLWDSCFLVHVSDLNKPDYNYTYLGDSIAHAYSGEVEDNSSAGMLSPNAAKLTDCYNQIIKTQRPIVDDGEFLNLHNQTVKYRQCLLPLGVDGQVLAIFGGMRFKIFPSA